MINQWGLYAGLGSSETAVAQPTDPATFRRLIMVVACIVGFAVATAAMVVLSSTV